MPPAARPPETTSAPAPSAAPRPAPPASPFESALAALVAHDAAGDWTDAACAEVAARFVAAAAPRQPGDLTPPAPAAPALHDAAVAESRCDHLPAAIDLATRALAANPASEPSRALLARLRVANVVAQEEPIDAGGCTFTLTERERKRADAERKQRAAEAEAGAPEPPPHGL